MSTNQTTNYQLHQWEAADNFLRTEINENFAALDTALKDGLDALETAIDGKTQVICGSYTGDGTTPRTISLGFRPKAVILANRYGFFGTESSYVYGGVIVDGAAYTNNAVSIVDAGFQVRYAGYTQGNASGGIYMYLAVK